MSQEELLKLYADRLGFALEKYGIVEGTEYSIEKSIFDSWKESWIKGWIDGWREGWRESMMESTNINLVKKALAHNVSISLISEWTGLVVRMR